MTAGTAKALATNVAMFPTALHGMIDGQPCRILATGDVEGNSPSYLTVNGHGQSQWRSFEDVQIIDTNYLPVSAQALQTLLTGNGGTSRK